ncbi:MAG TPA: hypothetical protein PLV25_06015, partial [Opitutales bacterium]|nr:hypothetical protein [Opitutales bacterium]
MNNSGIRQEFKLLRDCTAQTIPEAQSLPLKAGGVVTVVHALGQSITLETTQGLARLELSDLDVLGSEAREFYGEMLDRNSPLAIVDDPTDEN